MNRCWGNDDQHLKPRHVSVRLLHWTSVYVRIHPVSPFIHQSAPSYSPLVSPFLLRLTVLPPICTFQYVYLSLCVTKFICFEGASGEFFLEVELYKFPFMLYYWTGHSSQFGAGPNASTVRIEDKSQRSLVIVVSFSCLVSAYLLSRLTCGWVSL